MPKATHASRLLHFTRERGMVRPRDLERLDIPRTALKRLVDEGKLIRRSRGVYTVPEHEPTEHTDLAAVAKRAPIRVFGGTNSLMSLRTRTLAPRIRAHQPRYLGAVFFGRPGLACRRQAQDRRHPT
jgi:hypothetical protein